MNPRHRAVSILATTLLLAAAPAVAAPHDLGAGLTLAQPAVRAAPAATARPLHPDASARRAARCGPDMDGIERTGEGAWTIDRKVVRYHTASIKRINDLAYGRAFDDGTHAGWKVWGFGCDSPLHKGGLRSRDVVMSVNGKATSSIARIMALWIAQGGRDAFEVEVLRRGEVVTLHYTLTKG